MILEEDSTERDSPPRERRRVGNTEALTYADRWSTDKFVATTETLTHEDGRSTDKSTHTP